MKAIMALIFVLLVLTLAVVGVTLGFYFGYAYRDGFRVWGCTCKRKGCMFFGTFRQSCEAASSCRWWNQEPVEPVELELDEVVRDVTDM